MRANAALAPPLLPSPALAMIFRCVSLCFVALVFASFTPCSVAAQGESKRDDAALEPLAEALAAYRKARETADGIDPARAAVVSQLARLSQGDHPLKLWTDLGRAAWLAGEYPDERRQRGKVLVDRFKGGSFAGGGLEYAYRLPDGYEARSKGHALVIAIPDYDEKPAEHLRTHWTDSAVREGAIVLTPEMPAIREQWTQVMVAGRPGGLSHVLTAVRVATERFAVDFDRIYIVGRGKGVPAAVAAGNYGPHLFAGVVSFAGDVDELAIVGAENFSNLPTLFVSGGGNAKAFHARTVELDSDLCTLLPVGDAGDIWKWMQSRTRRALPTTVTVKPGDPFPTRAYWMRVAATAPEVQVTATLDSANNSVNFQVIGASRATLYLNDGLLDLDKPIRVVIGESTRELRAQRHMPTLLDLWIEGTSDPACFYTAELLVDLSGVIAGASTALTPAEDNDFLKKLADAGTDIDALWRLNETYAAIGFDETSAAVLRRIVRLQPDHARAREALGHARFGEHWFERVEARDAYERRQDPERATALGLVQHGGVWMHRDERATSSKGLTKDPATGIWLGAADRRRIADGWVLQDEAWIERDRAAKVDLGLWRVEGEWLSLAAADRRHARPSAPWRIPSGEIRVIATVDREVALRARREMERALVDLRRVFGTEPVLPIDVLVLRDEEQYDRFAFGAPDGRRPATSATRLHFIHSAYLAESWFERVDRKLVYSGMGVCYFDPLFPFGERYGVHSARLAAGFSFVEALDPSPKAVRRALTAGGPTPEFAAEHAAEKQLPAWLRYGGAVYAERFFEDTTVAEGGDRWWTRKWSLENIAAGGGWRGLKEVLEFPINPDERDGSRKLMIEAGLVVAFIVDGGCAPVVEAHNRVTQRLATGRFSRSDFQDLEAALLAHEGELNTFAGW